MQVELFSDKYKVCRLTSKNVEEVYDLLSKMSYTMNIALPLLRGRQFRRI